MMDNRLVQILQERKITKYELAKQTGLPPSSITDWTKHGRSPSGEKLGIVAKYLGVSVEYLLGIDEKPAVVTSGLSEEDMKVVEAFRQLSQENKTLVAAVIAGLKQGS